MELPKLSEIKNWSPEIEKKITEVWKNSEIYTFNSSEKKPIYSIDTPPPYVNSPIHMGHATTYCYMDFFARYKRMKGFQVIFPLGLDRNGLPIEVAAEKKYKVSPFSVSREEFIEYCNKILEETSLASTDTFSKLGISFTSYKKGEHIGAVYMTDEEKYRALTQRTFIELYKKGLIYEDSRINNWDPVLRTTVSDSEIERKDQETYLNFVKFKLKNSKETVTIATTRPELLCTSALLIFNPKDERYKYLKGKKAITPIFGNEVEIIEHEDADPNFGTGLVFMSSSGGDQDAVRFLRKVGIKPVSAIGIDGRMNDHGGFLKGLKTREAREKMIEKIKSEKLLEKQEKLMHSVPISERSKAEIEFVEMPEFYLKQIEIKEEISKISEEINFYPNWTKKLLDDWINSVTIDWPISRRRFYATEIPLWTSEIEENGRKKKIIALPRPGKYYQPWKEKVPEDAEIYEEYNKIGIASEEKFSKLEWKGEERVLDTWMDSSISELFILKYHEDESFFKRAFPATLRPQGKEIVRTWLYYTLLRGYLETKKPAFKDVWIHQHILDDKGKKMSKSLGNVIDPQEILKEYGAEAMRLWAATEGDLSKQDLMCSKEKINAEKKTINKLLNVTKFVSMFKPPKNKPKLTELDKLYMGFIEELTIFCEQSYDEYDFNKPALRLRTFLWDILASNYLELVKARAYNQEENFTDEESNSAKWTLNFILERLLYLIYPIIPQVTTIIAREKEIEILKEVWPKTDKPKQNLELIEKISEFNSLVWKTKKDRGISLRDSITGIDIPEELKVFSKDLIATHKLE